MKLYLREDNPPALTHKDFDFSHYLTQQAGGHICGGIRIKFWGRGEPETDGAGWWAIYGCRLERDPKTLKQEEARRLFLLGTESDVERVALQDIPVN